MWHLVWSLPMNTTWAGGLFVVPLNSTLMPGGSVVVPCDSLLLCSSSWKRDQTPTGTFFLNDKLKIIHAAAFIVVLRSSSGLALFFKGLIFSQHKQQTNWPKCNVSSLIPGNAIERVLCGVNSRLQLELLYSAAICQLVWVCTFADCITFVVLSQNAMSQLTLNERKNFPLRSHSNEHVTECESKLTQRVSLCQKQVTRPLIGWGVGRVLSCPPSFF